MRLGNLINVQTGKLDANAATENGIYPFFTCSQNTLLINKYAYDCECVLIAGNGDLNVKYYNGKFNAYQRTYIITSKDKTKLLPRFLYYFFDSYINTLRCQTIGGVIKYIKLENLTEINISIPDIPTQQKVIDIFDDLNNIIAHKKEQIELFNELTKSRFIELFGDPVSNSKNLQELTLPELGEFGRGVSKHRPRNDPKLLGGEYPLIQTGEVANSELYITSYENTYSELGLKQSKMWQAGTLCITIAANIAKTAILTFDACFPDSVVGFKANDKTSNIFIHYWFSFFQAILEAQAPESAQKNINLKILSELKIIVPPIEQQNEFVAFVEQTDKSKLATTETLKYLEELKASLMAKYFE